jgi:hypothetical protein
VTPEVKNRADMKGFARTVLTVEEESMCLNFRIFLRLSNEQEKTDGSNTVAACETFDSPHV